MPKEPQLLREAEDGGGDSELDGGRGRAPRCLQSWNRSVLLDPFCTAVSSVKPLFETVKTAPVAVGVGSKSSKCWGSSTPRTPAWNSQGPVRKVCAAGCDENPRGPAGVLPRAP